MLPTADIASRSTPDKITWTATRLFHHLMGGIGWLLTVVIVAVIIYVAKHFFPLNIPDSIWTAALVIVVGNDLASAIRELKR